MPHSPSSRTSRASSTASTRASRVTDPDVSALIAGTSAPHSPARPRSAKRSKSTSTPRASFPRSLLRPRLRGSTTTSASRSAHYIMHNPFFKTNVSHPNRNPILQTRPTRSSLTTLSPCMLPRCLRIPSIRTSSSSISRKSPRMAPCSSTPVVLGFLPLVGPVHTVKKGVVLFVFHRVNVSNFP